MPETFDGRKFIPQAIAAGQCGTVGTLGLRMGSRMAGANLPIAGLRAGGAPLPITFMVTRRRLGIGITNERETSCSH
jgi:hypothetical protein